MKFCERYGAHRMSTFSFILLSLVAGAFAVAALSMLIAYSAIQYDQREGRRRRDEIGRLIGMAVRHRRGRNLKRRHPS